MPLTLCFPSSLDVVIMMALLLVRHWWALFLGFRIFRTDEDGGMLERRSLDV
jgi:hypothetical protein